MKFGIVLFILTFAFFAGAKSKPTAKKRVTPVKKAAPVTPGPAQKPVAPNPKPVVPAPLIQTQDSVVHDVQDDLLGILLSGQIADYRGCKLLNGAFICDRKEINTKMVDPFGNELPTMLMANDELVCMLKNGFVSCTGNTWENDPYESKYGSQFDNADPQMETWKKVFQEDGDVLWIGNGNMDPTKDETSYNGEFCWLKPSGFYCKSSYQTPLAGVASIRQFLCGKCDGCAID